jgi:hypothetical protein
MDAVADCSACIRSALAGAELTPASRAYLVARAPNCYYTCVPCTKTATPPPISRGLRQTTLPMFRSLGCSRTPAAGGKSPV